MRKYPSYNLDRIKNAFNAPSKLRMTLSAIQSQDALGFSDEDVVGAIQALKSADFYKSMAPVNPLFSGWQDVYKSVYNGVELYIKFQINKNNELIVSFKEK